MRKLISIFIALVMIALAIFIAIMLINRKKPQMTALKKSMPLAYTEIVKNKDMPVTIPASGSLVAKNKIQLFSEVQGVFEESDKDFRAGEKFAKGDLIYKLNSDEFYTNLLAQKSSFQNLIVSIMPDIKLDFPDSFDNWENYINEFDITKPLSDLPKPLTDKEKRFIAAKNIYTNFYTIKNLEIKLDKYTIYAPFDGVLTIANVNPGTLVRPGQSMGEFVDTGVYEMEVSINSALASKIEVGDDVLVQNLEKVEEEFHGKIIRKNAKVDLGSQTVNIYIELRNNNLKEGMYLRALLKSKVLKNIYQIPRNLLVNQNEVYTVNDSVLQLQSVELVYQNAQSVIVRGLEDGQTILSKPVPKAFEGLKVSVSN
ncbi:MAG: efflux transporter periplasmic adaptor subunit [Marinilabiliales bacterium]|nr:MAG: efflux transporter periplasmic adaptor subunit [Marinilabiliales bacterium]